MDKKKSLAIDFIANAIESFWETQDFEYAEFARGAAEMAYLLECINLKELKEINHQIEEIEEDL